MYTPMYFYKKFSAIPEDRWITEYYTQNGKHCAYGHCGYPHAEDQDNGKSTTLRIIGMKYGISFTNVNDGTGTNGECPNGDRFIHLPTPKQRILAAFEWIIKQEGGVVPVIYEDITKELAIMPVEETSDLCIIKTQNHEIQHSILSE